MRALSKKYIVSLGIIALVLVSPLMPTLALKRTWKDDFDRTEIGPSWIVSLGASSVAGVNGTHLSMNITQTNSGYVECELNKTETGVKNLTGDFSIEFKGKVKLTSSYWSMLVVKLKDTENNYELRIGYIDESTSGFGQYTIDQNGTKTNIAAPSDGLFVCNITRKGDSLTVQISGDADATKSVTETHNFDKIEIYTSGSGSDQNYYHWVDYFYITYSDAPVINEISVSPTSIEIGETVKIEANITCGSPSSTSVKINITDPKGANVVENATMVYNSGTGLFEYYFTPQPDANEGYYNITVLAKEDGLSSSLLEERAFTVGLIIETKITITSSPLEVNPGKSFTITGYLKLVDGSALANRTVVISWLGVDYAVKTDSTGKYTKTLEVPEDTTTGAKKLVAKFLGDGTHLESSTSRYVFVISSSTISKYTSYLWLIPDYLADLSGLPSWLIGIGIILLVITAAGFIIGAIKQIWKFLVILWILYMFFALLGYI